MLRFAALRASATSAASRRLGGALTAAPQQPQLSLRSSQRSGMATAAAFGNVQPQEAAELVETGKARYLDVRTVEEFEAGHAPGALNIPVLNKAGGAMVQNPAFMEQVQHQLADRGESLVVGCKSGRRSEMACGVMSAAGYSGLSNVLGGWDAWAAAGLPAEK